MKAFSTCCFGVALATAAWGAQPPAIQKNETAALNAPSMKVERPAAGIELGEPPENDDCLPNNPLLPCNGAITLDNTLATTSLTDPVFSCRAVALSPGSGSVWYRLQPTNVEVTIQTCNTLTGPQDSLLQIFSGTCGALSLLPGGCDDYDCGTPTDTDFLSTVTVSGLTIGQTYIVEFAGWDAASQGVYQLDVACFARPGACCINTSCISDTTPEECYDAGGVWQGDFVTCPQALCVAAPPCGPTNLNENEGDCGQPQPDNYNGGPNSPSCIFFPDFPGDTGTVTICGTTSADRRNGSNRDTDWTRLVPLETTRYTACATGQSGLQVQFWQLGAVFDPCNGTIPGAATAGNAGTQVCASQCLRGTQQYAIRVAPVFNAVGAQVSDPQRFGIACVRYNLSLSTDACITGACCNPDLSCTNGVAEIDCLFAGGEYNGDGSNCTPGLCGGACCLPNGTCNFQSQQTCAAAGGSYSAGIPCAEVEPCPICQPEDPSDRDGADGTAESCTLADPDVNPGCSDGSPGAAIDFTQAECNETICGRAPFDGGFRDLDWYQVTVAQETEMLITIENGLIGGGTLLFRFRYYPNQQQPPPPGDPCDTFGTFDVVPATRGNQLPAGITVIPIVVPAGRYTFLVAYDFNTPGTPTAECPANYRVTLDCAAQPCAFACDANAMNAEAEGDCGFLAQTNAGCSITPTAGAFTPIAVGNKVCGTSRLLQSTGVGGLTVARDVDWYAITLAAGDYLLDFRSEFHSVLLMRRIDSASTPNCANPNVFGFIVFQCADLTIDLPDTTAGTYAIFVSPDFSSYAWFLGSAETAPQEFCPAPYELRVHQNFAEPCGDSNCDGFVTVGDIGYFVDAIVGGQAGWAARFLPGTPSCDFQLQNDANRDGFVTVGDIGAFVTAVSTGTPCQ
ncbi:MAG: hypothetical protein SF069_05710 [Phycisphaerae bacterium]|nr:hypothetical protein [Phycisphaerae bacterium]